MLVYKIANTLVILYFVYLTMYFFNLILYSDKRKQIQIKNKRLAELRKISEKSIDEQKEFINLKYPKTNKKITFKYVLFFILKLGVIIVLFKIYEYLFADVLNLKLKLWHTGLFFIIVPLILNHFLRKYSLHKDDISIFFR